MDKIITYSELQQRSGQGTTRATTPTTPAQTPSSDRTLIEKHRLGILHSPPPHTGHRTVTVRGVLRPSFGPPSPPDEAA